MSPHQSVWGLVRSMEKMSFELEVRGGLGTERLGLVPQARVRKEGGKDDRDVSNR